MIDDQEKIEQRNDPGEGQPGEEGANTPPSQWKIMWRQFKKNRLATTGGALVLLFYFSAIFAGFLTPHTLETHFGSFIHSPPNYPRFIDSEGNFSLRPFVYGMKKEIDMETLERTYVVDTEKKYYIYFFVKGDSYSFLNLFQTDIHLFGTKEKAPLFLLGTDKLGRDLFSRILYGAQISLTVGLLGVILSLVLGSILGSISGYYGGMIDDLVQRTIEIMISFPAIPMWMALAAALPSDWSPVKVYFGITIILALVRWGGLARQVRGMVLSIREEAYTDAAKAMGGNDLHIIFRHVLPNVFSHILVIATLSIPTMILGETALSFLGIGIRPPMTSWGVLLEEAQHVRVLLLHPWLLAPAVAVIIAILSFNFLGDGIRDAADPFATN